MTSFEELGPGFRVSPNGAAQPGAALTMAELQRAMEVVDAERRREHRSLICRPECADEIRAAVAAEGLSPWVDVIESALVDEGQVLVAHTPLDENGERGWPL